MDDEADDATKQLVTEHIERATHKIVDGLTAKGVSLICPCCHQEDDGWEMIALESVSFPFVFSPDLTGKGAERTVASFACQNCGYIVRHVLDRAGISV